jgi:putative ABC transport system permease protein
MVRGAKSLLQGISFGMRLFHRQPAFAACLAVTAAAGLAVNTSLFAIVDGTLLRGLPFPRANELLHLELQPIEFFELSLRDRGRISDLRGRLSSSATLSRLASYRVDEIIDDGVELSDEWRSLNVRQVSHDFFDVLGAPAAVGRTFTQTDELASPRPIVLSHGLWTRRFGADPSIVGRILHLPGTENRSFTQVVGILDKRFGFPAGVEAWIVGPGPKVPVSVGFVGRLAAGTAVAGVRTELPELTVMPLEHYVRPPDAAMMGYLLVGGVCLCLVAWLHLGSLLLARSVRRMPEFRLRMALGATPRDVRFELLGESLVVIAAALALACVLTPVLHALALSRLTIGPTIEGPTTLGVRSGAFLVSLGLLGAAVLSVIPIGVVAASQASSHMGKEAIAGRGSQTLRPFRKGMFVAQVAAATVLVYLTTLVAVSYQRVSSVPLGFNPSNLWAIALPVYETPRGIGTSKARDMLTAHRVRLQEIFREIGSVPGVVSVTGSSFVPMRPGGFEPALLRAESDASARTFKGKHTYIGTGFVRTLGIPLIAGREMLPSEAMSISDSATQPGEMFALANASLAQHLEPFGDPVGQIVALEPFRRVRIVGLVPDVRLESPDEAPPPMLFIFRKHSASAQQLLMRVADEESASRSTIRDAMQRRLGSFADIHSVDRWVSNATADYRVRVVVLVIMVVFSIPVTALGLVGAVTHVREERRGEFAIRMALGATPSAIERLVLRYFLALGVLGLAAGAVGAAILGHAMASVLFGVSSTSPVVGVIVIGVMTTLLLAAVAIPVTFTRSHDLGSALKD